MTFLNHLSKIHSKSEKNQNQYTAVNNYHESLSILHIQKELINVCIALLMDGK